MGVIRPPWITKEWFSKCPFNYCDHFGNKEMLSYICKICIEEVDKEQLKSKSQEEIPMTYVERDINKDLAKMMAVIEDEIKIKKISDNFSLIKNTVKDEENLIKTIEIYGNKVERVIDELSAIPLPNDNTLIINAIDVLSHSRHYIYVKIKRAYSSFYEERDEINSELQDDKTSAFYAFIAAERNIRALITLAKERRLQTIKNKYLKLAMQSIVVCLLIRNVFFPNEPTKYIEFGYNDFEL